MSSIDLIISDIHIGDNSRTCWYQKSVHEPYLSAIFDLIINQTTSPDRRIDRLVILGDLFDFWTYTPETRPPTLQQILDANPNIFGPGGKLSQVMEALNGNVVYLRGNHDINITQADLDTIPTGEHKIQLVGDFLQHGAFIYHHGHHFTMFNAPDPRYPNDLPVGHFVTRCVAHYVDSFLKPGQTAADLHDQGSPYGMKLSSLIGPLWQYLNSPSVTSFLLDYIAKATGMSPDSPIVLADGSTMTINQAKTKFDGLFTLWAQENGGGEYGALVASKAAWADYDGTFMAWFAQRAAFEAGTDGAIVGHTHAKKFGISHSWTTYVNSGFECPSVPDMVAPDPARFNFTVADDMGKTGLQMVARKGDTYVTGRDTAPRDSILNTGADYSSYVKINNNSSFDLVYQTSNFDYGYKVAAPPQRIPAGTTGMIWIQDVPLVGGTDGWVTYARPDGTGSMTFKFGCPYVGVIYSNHASGGAELHASSIDPPTSADPFNKVPASGSPLFVEFFVNKRS